MAKYREGIIPPIDKLNAYIEEAGDQMQMVIMHFFISDDSLASEGCSLRQK
jgi:hypothetical protein